MNYRISIIFLFILLSCKQDPKNQAIEDLVVYDKLLEVEMLIENMPKEDLVIIDFRPSDLYANGHIPGAVNIWRTDLENKDYPYSGMRPHKQDLEEVLGAKGIHSGAHLVVYDDKGSVDAARFWWLLKYYNFESVSILNGGLIAWQEAGGQLSKEIPQLNNVSLSLPGGTRDEMLATKEQLVRWLDTDPLPVTILDVRTKAEFSGKVIKKGAYRAGRIPDSKNLEWNFAIDQDRSNRFRTVSELKKIFRESGVYPTDTIVVYCHSGSRSAHTAFVLDELSQYKWIKNYDGSWTEWSYYTSLPIESDSLVVLNN